MPASRYERQNDVTFKGFISFDQLRFLEDIRIYISILKKRKRGLLNAFYLIFTLVVLYSGFGDTLGSKSVSIPFFNSASTSSVFSSSGNSRHL